MRRAGWLIVPALAAGLGLGAAAKGLKFPYLPERWNRSAEITEIELACLQSAFRAQEPLTLRRGVLAATEIDPQARATHIRLTVQVKRLGAAAQELEARELELACETVYRHWRERLMKRPVPPASECPVTIDLAENSKVLYREIRNADGRRGFHKPAI